MVGLCKSGRINILTLINRRRVLLYVNFFQVSAAHCSSEWMFTGHDWESKKSHMGGVTLKLNCDESMFALYSAYHSAVAGGSVFPRTGQIDSPTPPNMRHHELKIARVPHTGKHGFIYFFYSFWESCCCCCC